jgi:hypothetical protein
MGRRHPASARANPAQRGAMMGDVFPLIVEGITSMCSTPHFQCVLENVNGCDNPIEESVPPTRSSWKVIQGSAGLFGTRHISSP